MASTDDRTVADSRMHGFPPAALDLVTLANWQDPPNQRWAFRHLREVIPTQRIAAGPPRALPESLGSVGSLEVRRLDGSTATVDDVLDDTWTDALIVLQDGDIVEERYVAGMTAGTPHLLMSVSKSLVGSIAATLVEQGRIDPDLPVSHYVPEIAGTGYDGATVRDVLDMRTGVHFRETYTDPDAEVRVMERSMGWRPLDPSDPVGAYAFLQTLRRDTAHGGSFTYRSADTDMLGWVCERAGATRMANMISERIWVPMGAEYDAEITCDAVGTGIHDGGVSATARDLARFGQLLLDDGRVGQTQVIPQSWLEHARRPSDAVRAAFAASENEEVLPGGWYSNQFWFVPGRSGDVQLCLGIHGQMVHVDRATRTVIVKFSSWPDAQNATYLIDTLRSFGAIGTYLDTPAAQRTREEREL